MKSLACVVQWTARANVHRTLNLGWVQISDWAASQPNLPHRIVAKMKWDSTIYITFSCLEKSSMEVLLISNGMKTIQCGSVIGRHVLLDSVVCGVQIWH